MGAEVTIRCPRCKGRSFTMFERLEVSHDFRVEDGKALPLFCSQELPVQIGFEASCDCGHRWVPRHWSAKKIMDAEAEARTGAFQ